MNRCVCGWYGSGWHWCSFANKTVVPNTSTSFIVTTASLFEPKTPEPAVTTMNLNGARFTIADLEAFLRRAKGVAAQGKDAAVRVSSSGLSVDLDDPAQ